MPGSGRKCNRPYDTGIDGERRFAPASAFIAVQPAHEVREVVGSDLLLFEPICGSVFHSIDRDEAVVLHEPRNDGAWRQVNIRDVERQRPPGASRDTYSDSASRVST
jgi:hypothetical protein